MAIIFRRTDGHHNRMAKLSPDIVAHIRDSWTRKPPEMTQREFCDDWGSLFGVDYTTIRKVIRGVRWTSSN